jgi:hypothetical protein
MQELIAYTIQISRISPIQSKKKTFGTQVAFSIRQVLCHCRMADVCDDDGVSGESLRLKEATSLLLLFYTLVSLPDCF